MQAVLKHFCKVVYPLIVCLVVLQMPISGFAQGTDHVTITTYYPSPVGNFNQLSVGTALNLRNHVDVSVGPASTAFFDFQEGAGGWGVHFQNVPVYFERGVSFEGDYVAFLQNLTVNGSLTVNGQVASNGSITSLGDILADGNITAFESTLSGSQIRDTTCRYDPVIGGCLTLDLGASLNNRYAADVELLGRIAGMQSSLTAGFGVAVWAALIGGDFFTALAFAILGGGTLIETVLSWLAFFGIPTPGLFNFNWVNLISPSPNVP